MVFFLIHLLLLNCMCTFIIYRLNKFFRFSHWFESSHPFSFCGSSSSSSSSRRRLPYPTSFQQSTALSYVFSTVHCLPYFFTVHKRKRNRQDWNHGPPAPQSDVLPPDHSAHQCTNFIYHFEIYIHLPLI